MLNKYVLWFMVQFAFYAVFNCSSGHAGYLIVKTKPCHGEVCVSSLALDDPNRAVLYQILLDHSWPTAKNTSKLPEEEELNKILKGKNLNGEYHYVWVPDTLQDLDCASTLLKQKGEYKLSLYDKKKPLINTYEEGHEAFNPDTNEKFKELLKKQHASRNELADEIQQYFSDFNKLGKDYYFLCNRELAHTVISHASSEPENSHHKEVTLNQVSRMFDNKDNPLIPKMIEEVAGVYQTLASSHNHSYPTSTIIEIPGWSTGVLLRATELEVESNRKNEALLFRGTDGVGTLEGAVALDNSFSNRSVPGKTHNLSFAYGSSLLAGLFRESEPNTASGTACAMGYMKKNKYGYALKVQRGDPSIKELFEIPPLGLIGRLFGSGEYFHPRSTVGILGVDGNTRVDGISGVATVTDVKDLTRFNQIVRQEPPESLSKKINQYLSDHSVLIANNGSIPTTETISSVMSAQRNLAERRLISSPNDVANVVQHFLKSYDEAILKAGIGELGRVNRNDHVTLESIVDLLKHPDSRIRILSLSSLGMIAPSNPDIHKKMADRLWDESSNVLDASVAALGSLPLPFDRDTSHLIVQKWKLGSPEEKNKIISIFDRSDESVNLPPEIQIALAKTLDARGSAKLLSKVENVDPSALKDILQALASPSESLRRNALEAIPDNSWNEEISDKVLGMLYDNSISVGLAALGTLKRNKKALTPNAIVKMVKATQNSQSDLREFIQRFLAEVTIPQKAFQELFNLLSSDDHTVRVNAAFTLHKLDSKLSFLPEKFRQPVKKYIHQDCENHIQEVLNPSELEEIARAIGHVK